MNGRFTYVSPNLKKLTANILLVTSIGTILLTGCGVNNKVEENKVQSDTSVSIEDADSLTSYDGVIEVSNFEFCDNSSEFLAFIAEDGRIISTVPISDGSFDVEIPGDTKFVYSPVMDLKKEVTELNEESSYKISMDYKDKTLSFSTLDKSKVR